MRPREALAPEESNQDAQDKAGTTELTELVQDQKNNGQGEREEWGGSGQGRILSVSPFPPCSHWPTSRH